MEIGKYKQALSHLLKDDPLKNITFNSEARLVDNDPKPIESFEKGGRVGFQLGGLENIQKLSNGKYKFISRRGGEQTSKTFNTLEETIKFRDSYNERYPKEKAIFKKNYGNKEKLEKLEQIVLESNKNLYNSLSKEEAAKRAGYTSAANLSGRKEMTRIFNNLIPVEDKITNHFNDILKNIDNIPYQDIVDAGGFNKYLAKPFGTDAIKNSKKVSNVYSRPEFKDLRDMVKTMSNPQVIETYGNKDMYIGEVIDNLDTKKAGQRLKGGNLTDDIIMTADRSVKAGNKDIQFLTKPGSVDASDIVFKWNGKLYGKNIDEYKGKKVNNLTTDLYKLPEFGEYIEARDKLNTLRDKIVNHPVSGEPITIDNLLRETYSKGFENKSFYKSSGLDLDHLNLKDEPFSNLRPLPKHINQTAGLINKTHSIIEDKNKALNAIGYNIPEEALENSILKFSDRVLNKNIPISKTYDVGLRSITGGSKEYLSPESEITTSGLKEGRPGTENLFKKESQVMTSSGLRQVSPKERIDKVFNQWKQNILENNKIKLISLIGCPQEKYADGGRVNFSEGSNCYIKGIEKLQSEEPLAAKEINAVKNALQESGVASSEIRTLTNLAKQGGKNLLQGFEDIFISFGRTPGGRALGLAAVAPEIIHSGSAGLRGDYKEMARIIPTIGTFGLLPESLNIPGTDIDIGKGSTNLDIIKHAKEKGMDSESVKKIIDKNEAANKLDDFIGSRQDYLTLTEGKPLHPSIKKQLDDREKELNKQYNDINVNTSDWKNFAKSVYSFHERNRNRSLSAIQDKDTLNRDVENDYNETFRSLNPDFRKEYNIGAKEEKDNIINVGIGEEGYQSPDEISTGYADGGRVKLEGGGGPKMGRRGFLGLLAGAAAAAPELLKTIKGTSQVAKVASKIKLEPAEGMYSWFPNLVEKIKKIGTPFEEEERIMEASYKHEPRGYGGLPKSIEKVTKHVDGDTTFILREYPDGRIAVDIHSPRNQEGSSTPVTLYYRPKMELQYHTGKKIEPAEFRVLEKEPRYFANGPDDVDIEMGERVKTPGRDTIFGDVEAAERFATGDIQNRKIIPTKQSIREQMEEAPTDFIENHTPYGSYDPPTEILE